MASAQAPTSNTQRRYEHTQCFFHSQELSSGISIFPVHFPSQWKTYSCQRCKWDFLPLITTRNSAPIASCWRSNPPAESSHTPNPILFQEPCKSTDGPTAEAARGFTQTTLHFTDSREVSTHRCRERLRPSPARRPCLALRTWVTQPRAGARADFRCGSCFSGQIPQYQTHPSNCSHPSFLFTQRSVGEEKNQKTPSFQTHTNWQKAPSLTQFLTSPRFQIYPFLLSSLR